MIRRVGLTPRKKALALAVSCALSGTGFQAQAQEAEREMSSEMLEEIIVRGVRASQARAIDIKRNSTNIVDSIVAEDIGRLPDMTITDSLQRVTGVQISRQANEGTTLNIRGMPQVLSTLNGEQFLSPMSITGIQPDYSDIPASMMSGVDVYKSQSAKMLAGGISGIVDLKTLSPSSLSDGWSTNLRIEGSYGERSRKENNADGSQSNRSPDHNVSLLVGYKEDRFAVYANLNHSLSNAANYSIWENHRLGFLDSAGGEPGDPHDLAGNGQENWYIVPEQYGASSRFMERERTGASVSAEFAFNDNFSIRGDVFFTRMDKYDRGVKAEFNGGSTPESFTVNGANPKYDENVYNVIQPGGNTQAQYATTVTVPDGSGGTMQRNLYVVPVADIWAADFQTNSFNEIEKTAALNTNLQLNYTNHDNIQASVRYVHGKAERQYREATFQQGTPAWLWVDEDGIDGKDPVDGYHVTVDYRGKYPSFTFTDDLSSAELLDQYQGFAEGENTDATMNILRGDLNFRMDRGIIESLDVGLRYGVREANHNAFNYVTPTGRYTNWEDPRVPDELRYQLLPGNLIWQRYPDWLKFNYADTNINLIERGGLQDNGFRAADTISFRDFGPIRGFEGGVSALDPKAWDNPYAFMNRLYPGVRTVNNPGYTYGVEEASTSGYFQLNFSDYADGLFGVLPYQGNVGMQVVHIQRTVDKNVIPEVLDIFNSIGYDDWQKLAYVYDTERHKVNFTEVLPSFNLNLFPADDITVRLGIARTTTRNDLENVGASLNLWYQRCPKTDEDGNPVMVNGPSGPVQDDIGCVGGGEDRGSPDIKPWLATVYNASAEWYFAENSIVGVGLFFIDVDTAVEDLQEQRNFRDMDGIDRGNRANIWTTRNTSAADLYGIEIGYKQPFTFLPGEFLSSTGIEANYTYSSSESQYRDIEGNAFPLPSNSEHQANLILWYDRDGLSVRAAYNWRSKEYMGRFGINTNAAVLEMGQWLEPTGYLDLSVNYWLNEHVSFYLNGTNLTNQSRRSYAQFTDQFHSLWVQERRYSAGVSLSF